MVPRPTPGLIAELESAGDLHPLLVEDLLHAGQRPKVERYGEVLFIAVRSARYLDATEEVEFSEFHLLVQSEALVIICQDGRLADGTVITPGMEDGTAPLGDGAPLLTNPELLSSTPRAR